MRAWAVIFLSVLVLASGTQRAGAVEPSEVLSDPALEERAREISQGLRCLVCQNQTIDDSNAGLAKDLRILVRERLMAGDSNQEVMAFITDRYGDFVLLKPPLKTGTLLLWFGPGAILLLGAGALARFYANRRRQESAGGDEAAKPLSETEKKRLQSLLKNGGEKGNNP
ncbi:MAG: cytochrome c-type biogenesis protein CcmH [Alphaproteobacteria bacterium]|nr:cytochrome c-type biogenesis protein CcmH [Alphaproteobacteria bacterium]